MKVPALFRNAKHLCREQRGVVLIEMVIVLPVFLLLTFGVISFGYVFVVYEDEAIVVSTAGSAIQNNPNNPAVTQAFADNAGKPFITFTGVNTICAKSYAANAVIPNPYCVGNSWVTGLPAGVAAGTAYVVAVEAQVTPNLVLPAAYNWLIGKNFIQKTTVTVPGAINYPNCAAGQYVASIGGVLSCGAVPTCAAGQYLISTAGVLSCATPPTCPAGQALTHTGAGVAMTCIVPNPPSGSFCGDFVQLGCSGAVGGNFNPGIATKTCTTSTGTFTPGPAAGSCGAGGAAGYINYNYATAGYSGFKNNCFWTCIKN